MNENSETTQQPLTKAELTDEEEFRPAWVPESGQLPCRAGIYFDAVRVVGARGMEIAEKLAEATNDRPGPIITRERGLQEPVLYFVLPPLTAHTYRWPPGFQPYGEPQHQIILVPELGDGPGPYAWLSKPTERQLYVLPEVLHALTCTATGWSAPAETVGLDDLT